MFSSHFVIGGARSGKSRFAIAQFTGRRRVVFVATARAGDDDMARRIRRHRSERPSQWETVEAPDDLVTTLTDVARRADGVIVDCVTFWVANGMFRRDSDEAILARAAALTETIAARTCDVVLVSNEVGEGVHPETADGLRFRDLLGLVNQNIAAACDRVTLMVAGLPLTIKAPAPAPAPRVDVAHQAP